MFPEVLISILHKGTASPEVKAKELIHIEQKVADAIGEPYLIGKAATDTLPSVLGQLLIAKNLTLAAAESCSGGLLSHALVSIPGSSKFFLSSVVAYSNDTKATFLGVRPAVLARWGAVSKEIAIKMAHGAKYRAGADYGVSITGVAGPDGGSEEKPVGTFFIGLSSAEHEQAWEFFYPYERNMLRQFSAYLALDIVRRTILGFPTTWDRK
jgi:nicotinamide-nucleotide amidase